MDLHDEPPGMNTKPNDQGDPNRRPVAEDARLGIPRNSIMGRLVAFRHEIAPRDRLRTLRKRPLATTPVNDSGMGGISKYDALSSRFYQKTA
jgi:hypothetical protein